MVTTVINNTLIKRVTNFNYLGLQLSSDLNWDKHKSVISLKLTKTMGVLSRLRYEYPEEILLTHYNTLILPHLRIYKLAILKFYFKLINNGLPQYFDTFTPTFSMGSNHYNIRNPCRQLPKINHEFPKQSLLYNLNVVLNETDSNLISKAETSLYINLNS